MALKDIYLYGRLGAKFGEHFALDVESPVEALLALKALFPEFEREVSIGRYKIVRGGDKYKQDEGIELSKDSVFVKLGKTRSIHIVPDATSGGLEIGAVLIIGAVVAVAAVVIISTIKPPKPNDREIDKRESFIFDGGINREEQGHPVQLVYGRMRVGSVVGSGGINVVDIPYNQLSIFGDILGFLKNLSLPGFKGSPFGEDLIGSFLDLGGGKGDDTRAPIEDPNTLQSQAFARILDVISEGEIGGLVDGWKSVYFDDTVVQNNDGTYNFKGVHISERYGLPDQPYIEGYSGQEGTIEVDREVNNLIGPAEVTITDPDVNRVRIILRLTALSFQNKENGDILKTKVSCAIDLQSNGGGYTQVIAHTFNGKTNSPYQKAFQVNLPAGGNPWNIRVRRVTPDTDVANIQDDIFFDAYVEIVDAKLTYPNTAVIALNVDAKQFGPKIPVRNYLIDGIKIEVPQNYDPVTGVYTGIWDGTFKRATSSNPAWVFRDIITNKRYGLGRRIPGDRVNKWVLYTIAQYCDELVTDGAAGQQRRFTLNTVIETRAEAYDLLTAIAAQFRSFIYWSAGAIHLTQDAPDSNVSALVALSNTLTEDKEAYYETTDITEQYSAVIVWWNDPNDGYRLTAEVIEDFEVRKKIGWKPKEVTALGEIRRGGAHRFGSWLLEDQKASERITYTATLDQAAIVPGKIVTYSDPGLVVARSAGRLLSADTVTLTLDKATQFDIGLTYTVMVMLPSGTVEERIIDNPASETDTLVLATPLTETPIPGALWIIKNENYQPRLWRVMSIKEVNTLEYTVLASFHDPNKYARVEQNLILPEVPFVDIPTGQLEYPKDLTFIEFLKKVGETAVPFAQLSWMPALDSRVIGFQVQFNRPGTEDWEDYPLQSATTIELDNIEDGVYQARVRSFDTLGRKSPWAQVSSTFLGEPVPPVAPSRFYATPGEDGIRFRWDIVVHNFPIEYEIRRGVTWTSALFVTAIQGDTITIKLPATLLDDQTYLLKSKVRGVPLYSDGTAEFTFTMAPIPTKNIIATTTFEPTWTGILHELYEDNPLGDDVLILEERAGVRVPHGFYFHNIDLGAEYYARNWIDTDVIRFSANSPTWNDLTIHWDDLGILPWTPLTLAEDDITLESWISIGVEPGDLIEGYRLNGNTTGVNGDTATTASGLSYSPCKLANGLLLDFGSVVDWTITIPTDYTCFFDVKISELPTTQGTLLKLTAASWNISVVYDPSTSEWILVDDNADEIRLTAPNFLEIDGFILTPNLTGCTSVSTDTGLTFKKTAAGGAWDAQVYSTEAYTSGAILTFQASTVDKKIMMALNVDPTLNASFTSLDYAWFLEETGTLEIWESNVKIADYGSYVANDNFAIVYDNSKVHYLKNGVAVRSVAATAALSFFFDSSFNEQNGEVKSVLFGAFSLKEIYSFGFTQTTTTRTFFAGEQLSEAKQVASANYAALGAFANIYLGRDSGGPASWDSQTVSWNSLSATSWNDLQAGANNPFYGVYADLVFVGTHWSEAMYLERGLLKGPAGYLDFRPLIPGDYKYRYATIKLKIAAPPGVADLVAIASAKHNVDVQDVVARGNSAVVAAGTTINWPRAFYVTPEISVIQIGGAVVPAIPTITARSATSFTVFLYDAANPATAVDGTISWTALGY